MSSHLTAFAVKCCSLDLAKSIFVRYSVEQHDKHGFLKAPVWLWLGWMLLAKAWIVFIVAGASRESGAKILGIVYPDQATLYLGLAVGLPSIIFMWLIGLRNTERKWINAIVSWGRFITLMTVFLQIAQTVFHIHLEHGAFNWANGITLMLLLWLAIYLMKSRRVRDCLTTPVLK
ncbi:DUF2919 domain-containing protein [Vibrio sp. YMD68]|uniref:DUF2919 domain-containing protein n=1 Tax=Vibrio sp. YMD68 TaxID=3042300 RepID=UPI00249A2A5C|nr:DUF2919 domain-containing protein [Vibrio sp. YMD68]WGV99558.1 DUF2919 domain-containing protein [Vibrio sp. YMD68]